MTKHKLVANSQGDIFNAIIERVEKEGWQAIPSSFLITDRAFCILMFKVESNSPYRTEATL